MPETPNSNPEPRELEAKKSDEIKDRLESTHPCIKKPFNQWSREEKIRFHGELNNFWRYLPGGGAVESKYFEGKRDVPVREAMNLNIEDTEQAGQYSEKYLNGTMNQFFDNIRGALGARGIDVDDFASKNRLAEKYRKMGISGQLPDIFESKEALEVAETDLRAENLFIALPAFLDLIDSGYNENELCQ